MIDSMSDERSDEGENVVRSYIERVASRGELFRLPSLVSAGYLGREVGIPGVYHGHEGARAQLSHLRRCFGGWRVTPRSVVSNGSGVRVEWTATGTHERHFAGVEPTCEIGAAGVEPHGRRVTFDGVTEFRMEDGVILEATTVWDAASLRRFGVDPDTLLPAGLTDQTRETAPPVEFAGAE